MAGLVLCKLAGDRVIAPAHNGLNAYLLSCNIVKYLCPLAIGGKGLLADKTAYLTDNITEKSIGEHPKPSIALYINFLKPIKKTHFDPKIAVGYLKFRKSRSLGGLASPGVEVQEF